LRAQRTLPSVIEITLASGGAAGIGAALAGIDNLDIAIDGNRVRIACPSEQKVALLERLFALKFTVQELAIHEPSLEDLFLGYGGANVVPH
jgi:Cu-processing system ATP-binding protein